VVLNIRVSFIALRFEMFYCVPSGNVRVAEIKFGRARASGIRGEFDAAGWGIIGR
jgi:hypothetical protein